MSLRNERVRKTLMKEIADILQREIRDSRISGVISIMDVEVSHDNSYAKVYYSVFGGDEEAKEKTKEAIKANTSKIRYEVGKRIRLRLTPELRFIYDDSMDRASKVNDILGKISRGEV
jgi:ribosome-binding factor A